MASVSSESFKIFRDMVSEVFQLTMSVVMRDQTQSVRSFNSFLDIAMGIVQNTERPALGETGNRVSDTFEHMRAAATSRCRTHSIHSVQEDVGSLAPTVIVTKEPAVVPTAASASTNVILVQSVPADETEAEKAVVQTVEEVAEEEEEAAEEEQEVVEEEAVEEEEAAEEEQEVVEEEAVEEEEAAEEEQEVVEEEEAVEEEQEVVEEEEAAEEEQEVVEEEEAAEEEQEVVEEEEAAEEEEEAMEVIKIGKKQYFCGESSKLVYIYINDEEAGECLGKLVNGKIVPQ